MAKPLSTKGFSKMYRGRCTKTDTLCTEPNVRNDCIGLKCKRCIYKIEWVVSEFNKK
jgi:hypothetical protein